jgi:hypothetical protein
MKFTSLFGGIDRLLSEETHPSQGIGLLQPKTNIVDGEADLRR